MSFKSIKRLDGFFRKDLPKIERFLDLERFLNNSAYLFEFREKPMSFWTRDQIKIFIQTHTRSINPNVFRFCETESLCRIKIDFFFQNKPGLLHMIENTTEGQILLGKIHRWGEKFSILKIIIIDFENNFKFHQKAIPQNVEIIKISNPFHKNQDNNKEITKFKVQNNPTTGSWGFHVCHPIENEINLIIQTYIENKSHFSNHIIPNTDSIFEILQEFPILSILQGPIMKKYSQELIGEQERFIEWIICELLNSLFPKTFINQYRCDNNIFDLYWPNKLIIEFKWCKSQSDWDRGIGQIWTYAQYQLPIIIYAVQSSYRIQIPKKAFPPKTLLISIHL